VAVVEPGDTVLFVPSAGGQERLIKLHTEIDLYIAAPVTGDHVTIYLVIAGNLDLG
jgi:hypothetical protein